MLRAAFFIFIIEVPTKCKPHKNTTAWAVLKYWDSSYILAVASRSRRGCCAFGLIKLGRYGVLLAWLAAKSQEKGMQLWQVETNWKSLNGQLCFFIVGFWRVSVTLRVSQWESERTWWFWWFHLLYFLIMFYPFSVPHRTVSKLVGKYSYLADLKFLVENLHKCHEFW